MVRKQYITNFDTVELLIDSDTRHVYKNVRNNKYSINY